MCTLTTQTQYSAGISEGVEKAEWFTREAILVSVKPVFLSFYHDLCPMITDFFLASVVNICIISSKPRLGNNGCYVYPY
jgi:hypothetical protein